MRSYLLIFFALIVVVSALQGCTALDDPPTCRPISAPISKHLPDDLVGAWLSEDSQSLLVFSSAGLWAEHSVLHNLTPSPSPTHHGRYQAQDGVLTMRDGPHRRAEQVEALADRLLVWLSDDGHDSESPLIYWRVQCDTPSP